MIRVVLTLLSLLTLVTPARKFTTPNPQDVEILAIAIYCEAGSNEIDNETRYMVGDVILNRVNSPHFPDTIEKVLTAPRQYGTFAQTGVVWPSRAKSANEAKAVERAKRIAYNLLAGMHTELYGNGYVWQAGFQQGQDGFWQDNIYFGR